MKKVIVSMLVFTFLFAGSGQAFAQTTKSVTVSAPVEQMTRVELIKFFKKAISEMKAQIAAQKKAMTQLEKDLKKAKKGKDVVVKKTSTSGESNQTVGSASEPTVDEAAVRVSAGLGQGIVSTIDSNTPGKLNLTVKFLRPMDSVTYIVRGFKDGKEVGAKVTYPENGSGECTEVAPGIQSCTATSVVTVEPGVEYEATVSYAHKADGKRENKGSKSVKVQGNFGSKAIW